MPGRHAPEDRARECGVEPLRPSQLPGRLRAASTLLREPRAPAREREHHREGLRPHRRLRGADPPRRSRGDGGWPRGAQDLHGHRGRHAPRPPRCRGRAHRHGHHRQLLPERAQVPRQRHHGRARLARGRQGRRRLRGLRLRRAPRELPVVNDRPHHAQLLPRGRRQARLRGLRRRRAHQDPWRHHLRRPRQHRRGPLPRH